MLSSPAIAIISGNVASNSTLYLPHTGISHDILKSYNNLALSFLSTPFSEKSDKVSQLLLFPSSADQRQSFILIALQRPIRHPEFYQRAPLPAGSASLPDSLSSAAVLPLMICDGRICSQLLFQNKSSRVTVAANSLFLLYHTLFHFL
jgi:hypothetical protein